MHSCVITRRSMYMFMPPTVITCGPDDFIIVRDDVQLSETVNGNYSRSQTPSRSYCVEPVCVTPIRRACT